MAKFKNYRWRSIKTQGYISFLSAISLFALLQIWFLLYPNTNQWAVSFIILIGGFLIVFSISMRLMIQENRAVKKRTEDITIFIKTLSRGKLSHRIVVEEDGTTAHVEQALNELADTFEKQVTFLQKLADEKAELAEQAKGAAIVEERQRLARDLHDAVSQQLFALTMLASAARKTMSTDVEVTKEHIEDISKIALKAQGEMRALLLHLRPVHLSNETLEEGLGQLINELAAKTTIAFELAIQEVTGLSKGVEDHLFRLCQESLSNALRHSNASKVKLQLYKTDEAVFLKIYDNGKGFDITDDKKASYGLKTMQERCEEIGGKLTLTSQIEQGTSIDIRIPIQLGG